MIFSIFEKFQLKSNFFENFRFQKISEKIELFKIDLKKFLLNGFSKFWYLEIAENIIFKKHLEFISWLFSLEAFW